MTHDEAAPKQLRWPVGTVRSRLAGGRDRLRARLTRRGLAPSLDRPDRSCPRASIPPALMSTTIRVATTAGSNPGARRRPWPKERLIAMTWNKLKLIAARRPRRPALTVGGRRGRRPEEGRGCQGQGEVERRPASSRSRRSSLDQLQKRGLALESRSRKRIEKIKPEGAEEIQGTPELNMKADDAPAPDGIRIKGRP